MIYSLFFRRRFNINSLTLVSQNRTPRKRQNDERQKGRYKTVKLSKAWRNPRLRFEYAALHAELESDIGY